MKPSPGHGSSPKRRRSSAAKSPPPDPDLATQKELVYHHYDLVCRRFGVERGTLLMRKFACSYAQGLAGARDFRGRVSRVQNREEFMEVMRTTFPTAPARTSQE